MVSAPRQMVWLGMRFAVGVGFTVIVNVTGVPGHPPAAGVTVIVEVTGTVPALTAVNVPILPVPEAPRPIAGLLFVQL